jgi:hypothetical protein
MIDDLELLAANEDLQRLLAHYAEAAGDDRERWQPRLMDLAGVPARDLVRLHGELIAFGWVEQNTGGVSCCYRPTSAGLRALRFVRNAEVTGMDEHEAEAAILPMPALLKMGQPAATTSAAQASAAHC